MNLQLRMVLLTLGVALIGYILWDIWRRKGNASKSAPASNINQVVASQNSVLSTQRARTREEPLLKRSIEALQTQTPVSMEQAELVDPPNAFNMPKIMVLHVMAPPRDVLYGRDLVPLFKQLHLYPSAMSIYHRYQDPTGQGPCLFNVAQAVKPGQFDLANMDNFVTPGLALFMTVEEPNQAIATFELMLQTAQQIAYKLEGQLFDGQHQPLTPVTIEQYRANIRQTA